MKDSHRCQAMDYPVFWGLHYHDLVQLQRVSTFELDIFRVSSFQNTVPLVVSTPIFQEFLGITQKTTVAVTGTAVVPPSHTRGPLDIAPSTVKSGGTPGGNTLATSVGTELHH